MSNEQYEVVIDGKVQDVTFPTRDVANAAAANMRRGTAQTIIVQRKGAAQQTPQTSSAPAAEPQVLTSPSRTHSR